MTISVALFHLIGRSISYHQRTVMQDVLTHTPRKDILDMLRPVFWFTFGSELVGSLLLFAQFYGEYPVGQAMFLSVYHAVSAFCNAGFSMFSGNLTGYADQPLFNAVICLLIVVGGIGYPVVYNLYLRFRSKGNRPLRLAVQTKTALITSGVLIAGGALMFAYLEWSMMTESLSWPQRIMVPLFQSITCRTAGFNTVDIGSLSEATLALMIFLMFIGASPGSCGGGVKTTTLAVLTAFLLSRIRHRGRTRLFKKSIPEATVSRSITLTLFALTIVGLATFLVLIGSASNAPGVNPGGYSPLAYLFEVVSAFGTVGLSMGLTADLNVWGKFWIMIVMVIGRLGVLTLSYIIIGASYADAKEYSEENIMIG
jgi:trk system potassium uptake protein TrkH